MTYKIQLKSDSFSHITLPPWEKLLSTSVPPTMGVRGDRGLLKLKPHKNPAPQVTSVAFQMLHSQGWLAAALQIRTPPSPQKLPLGSAALDRMTDSTARGRQAHAPAWASMSQAGSVTANAQVKQLLQGVFPTPSRFNRAPPPLSVKESTLLDFLQNACSCIKSSYASMAYS